MLRTASTIGVLCAALAAGGCSSSVNMANTLFNPDTYSGAFSQPFLTTPDWARLNRTKGNFNLGPTGPVAPEELVSADGRCAPPVEAAPAAAPPAAQDQAAAPAAPAAAAEPPPPADRPVGSMAGDLASAPMPAAPPHPAATTGSAPPSDRLEPEHGAAVPSAPTVTGGVALGMSECQVVRRAGAPNNVVIGAGAKGDRTAVISYLGGPWPGVYHFESGRLKEVDAAPLPPQPAKPVRKKPGKKKKPVQQKSARHEVERAYVQ